ncbi:hypothetical protein H257_05746 [Aphanomyces astaci]|uniref:Uncharacterized protein n=1 Tax=Aphanomyces astaci TaxID=112090 RepID=W4GQ82_APHAT|nr:hypothetical protein H257_05746 [Aphanomyces astaci]ETV81159.1 hypothetical protein H257_05746 [Aphanomyces astaci]RQM19900.1 hypothetical protein B5M09_012334 [Aphanomyces astaci]|eukprot:XP_009829017.1 hypothetical protein H257_05746 [Aphanomyces astaci]
MGCEVPIFGAGAKYCERCTITLSLSLDATRTTMRSRKNIAQAVDIVEVLSSDEEREQLRLQQIENAEEISDDDMDASSDEELSDDLRTDDLRVLATDGDGVFRAQVDNRNILRSRTFARYRFRINDFPISTPLVPASAVPAGASSTSVPESTTIITNHTSHGRGKKRPIVTSTTPTKKKASSKKPASAYQGAIDPALLHYIQNPEDYAASEYESSANDADDNDADNLIDLAHSDGSATEDEEYGARNRRRRQHPAVPDEPCFICESRSAPNGGRSMRVQCPDCEGIYHRSCADAHDGNQTGCLQCADDDLIDDSELTEADLATTSHVFGAFHVKDEPDPTSSADSLPPASHLSPSRLDDDDADDDMVDSGTLPDVVPDASHVKQTILDGWKKFLDIHTAAFDADFVAATRAIEAANGFQTTLESDLHKLFQHYTTEQAKAEELERTQAAAAASSIGAASSSPCKSAVHDEASPPDTSIEANGHEIHHDDTAAAATCPEEATIDLTSDNDDEDEVVEVCGTLPSASPAVAINATSVKPHSVSPTNTVGRPPDADANVAFVRNQPPPDISDLPPKKAKRRIPLVSVVPSRPLQPKARPQDPRRPLSTVVAASASPPLP